MFGSRVLPVRLALCTATALLLVSCQSSGSSPGATSRADSTTTNSAAAPVPSPTTGPAGSESSIPGPQPGRGQVIVLDPGHNGGNATHLAEINKLVPAGRGQSKACNTTGTATNAGYPEHAFNWDVANRVAAELTARGFTVILTRPNDTGVGPCVDERAAIGNQHDAAAVVSIHADGSNTVGSHGFHVEYSNPPLNAEQGIPSIQLATTIRNTVRSAGFATANYIGSAGLYGRSDLGGLNLSARPTALIECGNMRDGADAAVLSSPAGRQRYADAIAQAIIIYLAN